MLKEDNEHDDIGLHLACYDVALMGKERLRSH